MNPITICPSTLAEGYDSYSPIAIKHLFDGRQVSPFLDYTPIDDDNNSAAQEEFLHNQERISLSGVQPKYSMIVRNGKLALTQKGEQGYYILKPKLSDFRNRIYSSANENLTMQIASQVFGIETAANGLCFFKGGEPAYITKRFDVKPDGTKRRKEDFASLAGLTTQNGGKNYKYEYLTYEECGELIRRYLPAWKVETLKFFDLIIFNFLICNGDAHLKIFGTRNRIRRFPSVPGIRPDKYQTACRRPDIRSRQRVAERQCRRIYALWNDQQHNFPGIRQKIRAPRQNYPTGTRQILHLLSAFRYADRQLLFIR